MAEKDVTEKALEDYEDVFADIYNTLVFKKRYLKTEQLRDGTTEFVYKLRCERHRTQYRDVVKSYYENTLLLASFGIENQSTVDKFMPVRIMRYDSSVYQRQLQKGKTISPIVTIVLNFSNKRWKKPKSLHGLMKLPKELEPWVQDYRILVFDIAYLEDDVIEQFQSDFKVIAKFFKLSRLKKEGQILDDIIQPIEHVEAVMDLLAVFTGEEEYRRLYYEVFKALEEKGEKITMCKVADAYMNKGREEGRKCTMLESIKNLMENLSMTAEQAMEALKIPVEERENYIV